MFLLYPLPHMVVREHMFLVFLRKRLAIRTQANLYTNHVQRGHRRPAGVQKLALLSHQRGSKPLEKLASKCQNLLTKLVISN